MSLNTLPHRTRAMVARLARERMDEREQLADLHAAPVPCASVALDYDNLTGRFDYPTRCVLADGHAEHHTDGCLEWSDWTAADDARVDDAIDAGIRKDRPYNDRRPETVRGLRYV